MAEIPYFVNIDLCKNILKNAVLHEVLTLPVSPIKGQYYIHEDKIKWYDGSRWVVIGEFNVSTLLSLLTSSSGKIGVAATTDGSKVDLSIQGLTKSDVGLSNVDNTSDLNKPISTQTQAALDTKASNSVVSTNSSGLMSATDKAKLDGIENGAEKNVNADWNALSGDAKILNKPSFKIKKLSSSTSGFSASYQLEQTIGTSTTILGDVINIPKDMVVESGSVKTVETINVPYSGAIVGDKYLELVLANSSSSNIYIPATAFVDNYFGGNTSTIKVDVNSSTRKITANIVSGSIGISQLSSSLQSSINNKVDNTIGVSAGNGLIGGGTLTQTRTLSVKAEPAAEGTKGAINVSANGVSVALGTTGTTAAPGNHSIVGSSVSAGSGEYLSSATISGHKLSFSKKSSQKKITITGVSGTIASTIHGMGSYPCVRFFDNTGQEFHTKYTISTMGEIKWYTNQAVPDGSFVIVSM